MKYSTLFLLLILGVSLAQNCDTCIKGSFPYQCDPGCPCPQDGNYCASGCCLNSKCISVSECQQILEEENEGLEVWAIVVIVIIILLLVIIACFFFSYCFLCCDWIFCCCPQMIEKRRASKSISRSSTGSSQIAMNTDYKPPPDTERSMDELNHTSRETPSDENLKL